MLLLCNAPSSWAAAAAADPASPPLIQVSDQWEWVDSFCSCPIGHEMLVVDISGTDDPLEAEIANT